MFCVMTQTEDQTINDWRPETRSLLDRLIKSGFTIQSVDNFEYVTEFSKVPIEVFVRDCMCCDECVLRVTHPKVRSTISFYLVYGNSPGELVCDGSHANSIVSDTIEELLDAHYTEWSEKKQPVCKFSEIY